MAINKNLWPHFSDRQLVQFLSTLMGHDQWYKQFMGNFNSQITHIKLKDFYLQPPKEIKMTKNSPLIITAVGNGFHVSLDSRNSMANSALEATKVFQSIAELNKFLEGHFKHRAKGLKNDSESISLTDD